MSAEAPLAGLRVIELSAFVAAPLGGMTLAQLGAEVIRIDLPGGGLDYRRWPVTEDNNSMFWAGLNKAKRSATIDFSKPEGKELVSRLITAPGPDAGIVLTNFPDRGWLAYEALSAGRADLIQLVIEGDRHGGSAVDYTVNPRLGLPLITGSCPDAEVVNHVLPAWDLITGQMAAVGLLAAERKRTRTGEGGQIRLALEDVGLAVLAHLGFIAEAERGVQRTRVGNDLFGAFGRDFKTRDQHRIMVVALTVKQWKNLCTATQIEQAVRVLEVELGVDLNREGERYRYRNRIAELVGPWIETRELTEIAAVFDAAGVCWAPYQSVGTLVETDPACSTDNPMFVSGKQPGIGATLIPGMPLRFESAIHGAEPAPVLGADTEQVLSQLAGVSTVEFGRLRERGVV